MSEIPPVNDNELPDPSGNAPSGEEKDWKAEADKWKSLARTHESKWKAANDELDTLRAASMSEAEKAIEDAKKAARQEALSEVGGKLVQAELKAAAAESGVKLPEGFEDVLNLSKFLGDNGSVNTDAVTNFVNSLGGSSSGLPKVGGIGPQHGDPKGQVTRDQLSRMSPAEIMEARSMGRLNNILGIETN